MDVIIPCAGFSTRFPNMRPKYLLADYLTRRMIELSAGPYLDQHRVHAVILKQHDLEYNVSRIFNEIFQDKVNLIILDEPTSGPAETIYQALRKLNLPTNSAFLVHDCDSMFAHPELEIGNRIHVASLNDYPSIRTPAAKSFVEVNDQGIVVSIIEKKIISDLFCVGGYQFASVDSYCKSYIELSRSKHNEIFISSVVDNLISQGEVFTTVSIEDFVDLGTKEDWDKFNDRPTIFCDIDGTIVKNQAPYGDNHYGTSPILLEKNILTLKRELERGSQIIFTTSRKSKWYNETRGMLNSLGFENCPIIMDLHHARRIVINDYAATNPYPSAVAVNLKRDDDCLDELLQKKV